MTFMFVHFLSVYVTIMNFNFRFSELMMSDLNYEEDSDTSSYNEHDRPDDQDRDSVSEDDMEDGEVQDDDVTEHVTAAEQLARVLKIKLKGFVIIFHFGCEVMR